MSLENYLSLSSASNLYPTTQVADLTGRVSKTEPYSVAWGGHGEIWKAEVVQNGSSKVRKYFILVGIFVFF